MKKGDLVRLKPGWEERNYASYNTKTVLNHGHLFIVDRWKRTPPGTSGVWECKSLATGEYRQFFADEVEIADAER